ARAATGDLEHDAKLTPGSHLEKLAGAEQVRINSSHHQSIDQPGRSLRITARGADGNVESVELQSAENWGIGVQWHPERMPDDAFAQKLFSDFIKAMHRARPEIAAKD